MLNGQFSDVTADPDDMEHKLLHDYTRRQLLDDSSVGDYDPASGRSRLNGRNFDLNSEPFRHSAQRTLRRLIDLAAALVCIPFLVPMLLVAALVIRLDSPGSAIFRQVRMGFLGKPFVCFKLRTMFTGSEGPPFTEVNDTRVTPIGRFIRKWHIDELPQVLNVLRGEMSWIGPRPEAFELAQFYARHIPAYHLRHSILPGITGWAAVNQGNVGNLEAAREKLEYDAFYVDHRSIWLDAVILLRTIMVVAAGTGAR